MAKYCDRCGKPLPDGVEICPDCSAGRAQEDEAALFTRMTSETEVWKSSEPVKRRRIAKMVRSNRSRIALYSGAVVLIALAVCLILFFRPEARVLRELNKGEIEAAYELFWSSRALCENERSEKLDSILLKTAEKLNSAYANHELDADTAASELSMLGGFGDGAAGLLEPVYAEFRAFNSSQLRMNAAEALFFDGDYLAAREAYLQVDESDAFYADAQEKAELCLIRYGESVGEEAELLMSENKYMEAIAALNEGNDTLYTYHTFSETIDELLPECRDRYEQYILDEAAALAALEDYDGALARVRSGIADFEENREALICAEEDYFLMARDKHIEGAKTRSDAFYEQGDVGEAFAELETLREQAEENEEGAAALIAALEARYTEDTCLAAEETFALERDKLPDAIAILDAALEVRELEGILACRDELTQYLPLSLAEAEYYAKSGTVFRTDGEFDALDGTKYKDGWLWGEDGAEISFALDGAYDEFTCTFAVRRDDDAKAEGSFEVWCDGERVLESETLRHSEQTSRKYTVDVSGCSELRLAFVCDYEVSTAESGYCYHGLCSAIATKNIPETWKWEQKAE